MSISLRSEVLRIYRQLLRTAADWSSTVQQQTQTEQQYIRTETKTQFTNNKHLTDSIQIQERISEAKLRLALAQHYNNPFPRPLSYPLNYVPKSKGKAKDKLFKRSIPSYLRSSYDTNK